MSHIWYFYIHFERRCAVCIKKIKADNNVKQNCNNYIIYFTASQM